MQEIAVEMLRDHEMNDVFFDPISGEKWEKFLESVKTSGIIEPLIVTQDNVIVSGHQRKRACLELGINTVKCDVREYYDHDGLSKEEWIIKDLIETNVRQRGDIGGNELKLVRRVDALCDIYRVRRGPGFQPTKNNDSVMLLDGPSTVADTCGLVGIGFNHYQQLKPLKKLEPEFLDKLEDGEVSASVAARIIAKLSPEQQQELLSLLPDGIYVSKAVADEYIAKIQSLAADNEFLSQSEESESARLDGLTQRLQEAEENNERLMARGKTAAQIAEDQRAEARQRKSEEELKRQQDLITKLQDRLRGDSAVDSRVVALFVALAGHVDGLLEIPTSVYKGLGKEGAESVVDYITSIIDGLQGVQEILAGGDA